MPAGNRVGNKGKGSFKKRMRAFSKENKGFTKKAIVNRNL